MNPDIEEAGSLITAGLAARELDRVGAPPGMHGESPAKCANCGAPLDGPYCRQCGQAAHLHRTLLHLTEEVLHGVVHFDAKGWRTLPLLIMQPGLLTRRYIDGQRTRYVSPLALFLFCVFLMFFVFSLVGDGAPATTPARRAEIKAQLAEEIAGSDQEVGPGAAQAPGDTWEAYAQHLHVHTGFASLDAKVHQALGNPDLFLYKLKNLGYKFSFLLIPISLPFLWLMFIGHPSIAVYDHAVFSLYSLSFMALLFVAAVLLSAIGLGAIGSFMVIGVPPLHMYRQLRGTYGLGKFGALWRTVLLIGIAGSAFALFLLFILTLSLH